MKKGLFLCAITLSSALIFQVDSSFAGSAKTKELAQKDKDIVTQPAANGLSGKVVETMNAGGYTYVSIEKNGKKTWVAVPETKISVGQEISFEPGMVMNNFESKTLKRTFESIVFSVGVVGKDKEGSAHGQTEGGKTAASAGKNIKVQKASGPDAYTVAELFEKSKELKEKKVVVRGQVVKVSPSIMGKNWVHLQDGSGNASKGTHDILITSQDLPSIGDVVTARGTLYKDKDFGSGYSYEVIIEEASISK
jgi:hypothetical protein